MRSLMKRGEPENGSPGCLAKSRMFRLFLFFAFNLPFYFFTVLPLKKFRLQNPENLNNVLVNNIINILTTDNYGNQEHFEDRLSRSSGNGSFNRGL